MGKMRRVLEIFRNNKNPVKDFKRLMQTAEGGTVTLERDEVSGIATICLNQHAKKNAISGSMMVALDEAVTDLESWNEGKGLIVYGAEHNFCSGGDLDFVRTIANPSDGLRMASYMQGVLTRLKQLPLVSAAVIEGSGALGGGAEIALACDWRLIAKGCAGIGFVHRRMGIAPAWGGATWLTQMVGYRTALDLMTTGRLVSCQEAMELGLADFILVTDDPLSEALVWLSKRTYGPLEVVRSIKQMALNANHGDFGVILEKEGKIFSPLWGGPANLHALKANTKHRL